MLDAFLKIEGDTPIAGESTDSLHASEIEVLTFGHSMGTVARDDGNRVVPGLELLPFVVIKPLDSSTPYLCKAACARTAYSTITLSLCQRPAAATTDAKVNVLTIKLERAIISRVTMLGSTMGWPLLSQSSNFTMPLWMTTAAAGNGPLEQVEILAGKYTWTYNGNSGTGNIQTFFDTAQFNALA
jgi:type VI secretion system Hcp family effector